MSDPDVGEGAEFANWYNEGSPLPVCHPIPHCSAQIRFPNPHEIVWEVTDHKLEKAYSETFEFKMEEITDE